MKPIKHFYSRAKWENETIEMFHYNNFSDQEIQVLLHLVEQEKLYDQYTQGKTTFFKLQEIQEFVRSQRSATNEIKTA